MTRAFDVGRDAFVFLLQAAGQHDVGMLRGLREEEVDDAEELELLQRLAREVGVGQRDQRVEADREQPLDLAAVNRVHDLDRAVARRRASSSGEMPQTPATCCARGRIGDGLRWPGS